MNVLKPGLKNAVMGNFQHLNRFIDAQQSTYSAALSEIRNGKKQSHWMWFIFPQIRGLGSSDISKYYAIKDLDEAESFVKHPILGPRLIEVCYELVNLESNDANEIFGKPDDLKLRSSMTLFASVEGVNPIFKTVLSKYFKGVEDNSTLEIINNQR
jgi:uncharacterized protein (DUF1810 family)